MQKTSKTPISDKAAFDAYPYAIGGRVIAAKVVMFSVAEKLELELAELLAGRDFWRNKCEKIESDQTILNIATLAENAELRQQVERMKCCENCEQMRAGDAGEEVDEDICFCCDIDHNWRLKNDKDAKN